MPFGVGAPELILILVVALIVFGPRKLPELGRSLGNAIGEFRRATTDITRELNVSADPMRAPRPAPPAEAPAAIAPPLAKVESEPAPADAVCETCGKSNPASNAFCGHCGGTLRPAAEPAEASQD